MALYALLEATTTGIDTGLVTQIIDFVKSIMGLFGVFPLNIFLTGGLFGMGFGIFKAAKRAAKK